VQIANSVQVTVVDAIDRMVPGCHLPARRFQLIVVDLVNLQ